MEAGGDGGSGGLVLRLIDKSTNSTEPGIDPRLLKAIKSAVRYSDSELRLAFESLMTLMKRDHSQVRYLSLLIIDELFMRSSLFRALTVEKLDQLLTLSVGFRRNHPLPAPESVASVLRSKAIEFLEKWNSAFGIHYRQLRLGHDYLKNTLRFQFPNIQVNTARIQQERRERERRTKEILLNKFEQLKLNVSSIKLEIRSTLDEIRECLDILSSRDENVPLAPLHEEDMEEFRNSELRQIRLDSLREADKINENSENKIVFDALRELYKLLVTKHLVMVQESIYVLIRVELPENRLRDYILKEFIDVRNRLKTVKKKCEESGCALTNASNQEEGEDIWEDAEPESLETTTSAIIDKQSEGFSVMKNNASECSTERSNEEEKLDSENGGSELHPLKKKLLAEAPVKQWGSFLDNWGLNRDFMANQRGLELEGHWGRVDFDAVIPAKKIAELNVQASIYREELREIPQCRAPLKKGGLCQRRDLKFCPFHGPIIDRDENDKPIDQTFCEEVPSHEVGSISAEELAKQAVKKVREREKEAMKKREHDKHELRKAKLAKVRGHNEAVLRDAAMASTSRSSAIGDDESDSWEKFSGREKRKTLAKMLKKKVTVKDRLSRRLLNTNVRDSTTRQLDGGEDAKYREAFANQWATSPRLESTATALRSEEMEGNLL